MSTALYPGRRRALHGIHRLGPRVTSVYKPQCALARGLRAILHHHPRTPPQLGKALQQRVTHTVGARRYHHAHHIGHAQRLFVTTHQLFFIAIRVGIGLKIGQVTHIVVFASKEALPLLQLLGHSQHGSAIFRIKRAVIAVCTPAATFRAITVRAREPGIHRYLLHLIGELFPEEITVISPLHCASLFSSTLAPIRL